MPEAELIVDAHCHLGENPLWHPGEKRLYWVDIDQGLLHWFDPATEKHGQQAVGDLVGGFTLQEDGALLLFMNRGAIKLWRGGQISPVFPPIPGEEAHRFNDVIADPAGRVFCGTLCPTQDQPGRLYRLDIDGTRTKVLDDVWISNGMGYTADRKTMYHTDSRAGSIYCFDYDAASGAITNRRVFVTIDGKDGVPDGLTIDVEGGIWSAIHGGSYLARFTPDGVEERRISVPTANVTSITFGGDTLEDMYITSSGGSHPETYGNAAGALFRVRPGVRGVPEFRSQIAVP